MKKIYPLSLKSLTPGKKIYFASDFHLKNTYCLASKLKEKKIIRWLNEIKPSTHALFLLGDIFDFWFEYKEVVPKGFIRLLGTLAAFTDNHIPVFFFTGNHDLWMSNYLSKELNITIIKHLTCFTLHKKKFLIGHGDDIGATKSYIFLKKFLYSNHFFQQAFHFLHPNIGITIAKYIVQKKYLSATTKNSILSVSNSHKKNDRIFQYCQQYIEPKIHHNFYIFGHIHYPLSLKINDQSYYYNIGDWVKYCTYGQFDGYNFSIKKFI